MTPGVQHSALIFSACAKVPKADRDYGQISSHIISGLFAVCVRECFGPRRPTTDDFECASGTPMKYATNQMSRMARPKRSRLTRLRQTAVSFSLLAIWTKVSPEIAYAYY